MATPWVNADNTPPVPWGSLKKVLPGCVSTGKTFSEIKSNIREAIDFHVESSLENNDHVPDALKDLFDLKFKISK